MKKSFFAANQITSDTAELLIYGDIFPYEGHIRAADVVGKLRELEQSCTKIHVRINSNGGDVFEGITIFNALRNSKCEIHTYIDGIAASMGSVIAMAGKKVFMSKYARLMTHKPSGGSYGSSEDLRRAADDIDSCEKILNEIYSTRTGLPAAEVTARFLNGKDNYFNATDAMQARLIDGIYDGEPVEVPQGVTACKDVWSIYDKRLQAKLNPGNTPVGEEETIIVIGTGPKGPYHYTTTEAPLTNKVSLSVPKELFEGWDRVIDGGKMDWIKKNNPALFAALYRLEFGTYPVDMAAVNKVGCDNYVSAVKGEVAVRISNAREFPEELYMTWDELIDKGKMDEVKSRDYTLFAVIYKEEFGAFPKIGPDIKTDLALKYQTELLRYKTQELYQ